MGVAESRDTQPLRSHKTLALSVLIPGDSDATGTVGGVRDPDDLWNLRTHTSFLWLVLSWNL